MNAQELKKEIESGNLKWVCRDSYKIGTDGHVSIVLVNDKYCFVYGVIEGSPESHIKFPMTLSEYRALDKDFGWHK